MYRLTNIFLLIWFIIGIYAKEPITLPKKSIEPKRPSLVSATFIWSSIFCVAAGITPESMLENKVTEERRTNVIHFNEFDILIVSSLFDKDKSIVFSFFAIDSSDCLEY